MVDGFNRVGGCDKMGQPTSGIAQRAGYTQLWQHTLNLEVYERGYGEQQFRISIGARLALLLFQSLLLVGREHLWFCNRRRLQNYNRLRWERYWRIFPNLRSRFVVQRYFLARGARHMLFDGEMTYLTLAFRHRRLRLASIYWAQPRIFRLGQSLALIVRGYNVTSPRPRRPRVR